MSIPETTPDQQALHVCPDCGHDAEHEPACTECGCTCEEVKR